MIAFGGLAFLIISMFFTKSLLNKKYSGYEVLNTCRNNNFVVENIKEYKGVLYINDSIELATAYNNETPIVMLHEFLETSDSIVLKKSADTLKVYRNGKNYWFKYFGKSCDR